jgi:hypothetical protein
MIRWMVMRIKQFDRFFIKKSRKKRKNGKMEKTFYQKTLNTIIGSYF